MKYTICSRYKTTQQQFLTSVSAQVNLELPRVMVAEFA